MDVASIIASVEEPGLRREMLQNLSQEQVDLLPSALRTEALNIRRGQARYPFDGRGGHRGPPAHQAAHRGHPRDEIDRLLERQRGLFMNAVRREEANEDPYRQRAILPDPTDLHYDEKGKAKTDRPQAKSAAPTTPTEHPEIGRAHV